jgi:hypothetical protein
MRAAVKYGLALAHAASMYRYLRKKAGRSAVELEMSVDETGVPTSPLEHACIALELRRLGVEFVSLAPRFVGDFEKGVDYKGDIERFRATLRDHAAIARALGPYKVSVHSGSDKFSIYPAVADAAGELVHLKTAGTSYLEALRVVAGVDPELFRRVLDVAADSYGADRRSYHVSADLAQVPRSQDLADGDLPGLLDSDDARQVLHVTYGSVLAAPAADGVTPLKTLILKLLDANEEAHWSALQRHLGRHVEPFRSG